MAEGRGGCGWRGRRRGGRWRPLPRTEQVRWGRRWQWRRRPLQTHPWRGGPGVRKRRLGLLVDRGVRPPGCPSEGAPPHSPLPCASNRLYIATATSSGRCGAPPLGWDWCRCHPAGAPASLEPELSLAGVAGRDRQRAGFKGLGRCRWRLPPLVAAGSSGGGSMARRLAGGKRRPPRPPRCRRPVTAVGVRVARTAGQGGRGGRRSRSHLQQAPGGSRRSACGGHWEYQGGRAAGASPYRKRGERLGRWGG